MTFFLLCEIYSIINNINNLSKKRSALHIIITIFKNRAYYVGSIFRINYH